MLELLTTKYSMRILNALRHCTRITSIDCSSQYSCKTFEHRLQTLSCQNLLLRDLSSAQKSFFCEVCRLAQLILVMPATNAVSERSFLAMRHLKTYLRSTMCQSRFNHVMLLNLNKERVDELDIDSIANQFIQGSEFENSPHIPEFLPCNSQP